MQPGIKTSVLIISDTHGMEFDLKPLGSVDVAIHCGDLTDGSKVAEFRRTIKCLSQIQSPLKLAIAGNHDFTMDVAAFEEKVSEAIPALDPSLVAKEYGHAGDVVTLFREAKDQGIQLLDEGNHQFTLANGALLTVYASPYTPSMGAWGFQYRPEQGHDFAIAEGTDIVVTHGPPKGIMDFTHGRERAGCPSLFAAIAQAVPRVHCFGHIHEGWGARRVTWRETYGVAPTHFTAIDNDRSSVIESLSRLEPSRFDGDDDLTEKQERSRRYMKAGCVKIDQGFSGEDVHPLKAQTLFVNASMTGSDGELSHLPWIVYVDLPTAITNANLEI